MVAVFLFILLGTLNSYAAEDVFTEPKMVVNGGIGMSNSDRQDINSRLDRMEALINQKLAALENRVNTALQNAKGPFASRSGNSCPAGYRLITLSNGGGYGSRSIDVCYNGRVTVHEDDTSGK